VYRKGVFDWVQKKGGTFLAFSLNTFLFGFMHVIFDLGNAITILPYLAAGAVLTYIYLLSQKVIWVPIVVHMSYNLLSLLVIFSALQERFSGI
jgi:membrane protease YdiL (CAAX protease family)